MNPTRLVLFTRWPEPGKCKTRLIPALGETGAMGVHKILTERTVALMRQSGASAEIAYTGADEAHFRDWLGGDLRFVAQADGDLSARLLACLDPSPVLFLGADTPDLTLDHVTAALAVLADHDVVIGPAEDGGYWGIGVRAAQPALFTDMPWSTERVMSVTMARIEAMKLSCCLLETLADCDRPEDLSRWPWLTP